MKKVYLVEARFEIIEDNGYRTVISESVAIFSTAEKARTFVAEKENDLSEFDDEVMFEELAILEVEIDSEEWCTSMRSIEKVDTKKDN